MVTVIADKPKVVGTEPRFRDPATMTYEELNDPDYALKRIARQVGIPESRMLVCSKCHHCRG